MKIFKGARLTTINDNKLIFKPALAYQLLLGFVALCVTFFSVSTSCANERDINRRTAAVTERMLEQQAARSMELLFRLQENQLQSYGEQQVEDTLTRSAEDMVQLKVDQQRTKLMENYHKLSGAQRVRFLNSRIRQLEDNRDTLDHTDRHEDDLPQNDHPQVESDSDIEVEVEVEEEAESEINTEDTDELANEDDLLGSYDPDESEEPTEKGNDEIEDNSSEQVEDQVEDDTTEQVEEQVSEQTGDEVEDQVQEDVSDSVNDVVEDVLLQNPELLTAPALFDVSDLQFEQALDTVQSDARILENIDERTVWTNQWVIMADAQAKDILEQEGYEFSNEEHLEAFDSIIANVKAPASYNLFEDYQLVMEKLNKHDAVLDLNHVYTNIYTNATQANNQNPDGLIPGDLMTIDGNGVRIGMVDTAIDTHHKFLKQANIVQRHFTQDGRDPVYEHGTAVASVFSGASQSYSGVIEGAQLYNASVFIEADQSQSITTALSLMKGLNWLVQQDIKVINMSLAGPPNRLLQKGIQQLCQQGVVIVAAAGNDGPFSEPMYPAGYGCAIAVTAVDSSNKLYKKAVRGNHIDVAAYGVDIMAASDNDSVSSQSGTSIAAPFVSAWIASQLPGDGSANNWLELALENCIDLGEKGIDPLYGKGLLPFDALQLAKLQQFNHLEMVLHR